MTLKLKNTNFIKIKALFLINNTNVNKIVVSNKLPFSKQDFRYFLLNISYSEYLVTKILKMIVYKRNFDENIHTFF